ncbi:MAG: STAS domain-containing protein [Bryobacterales bacterium]|nr:STAS domain-containing protein [Bryobacterales bacterium]
MADTQIQTIEPDITVLPIKGRLNLGTNLTFLEIEIKKLINGGAKKLILDLSELTYIDSAGIGMLMNMWGQSNQAGGKLVVAGAQGTVAESFSIVHLDRVIPLHPDVNSAAAGL